MRGQVAAPLDGAVTAHPAVGTDKVPQNAASGVDHPRTLIGIGIENDDDQMEDGDPVADRAGFAIQRRQLHIGVKRGGHRI